MTTTTKKAGKAKTAKTTREKKTTDMSIERLAELAAEVSKLKEDMAVLQKAVARLTVSQNTWEAQTLEELAEQRRVKPATSLSDLEGRWPEDDNFDEFIEDLRSLRKAG